MLEKSVVENCWREVLEKSVVETSWREMLEKSVVEKGVLDNIPTR